MAFEKMTMTIKTEITSNKAEKVYFTCYFHLFSHQMPFTGSFFYGLTVL